MTDVTADSISLSWNSGNVEPISSYVVQFRPKYPPTTSLGGGGGPREGEEAEWRETVDVRRTQFTVRGLAAFTVYELRVLAVASIGRSLPSTSVDVTTAELGNSRQLSLSISAALFARSALLPFVADFSTLGTKYWFHVLELIAHSYCYYYYYYYYCRTSFIQVA